MQSQILEKTLEEALEALDKYEGEIAPPFGIRTQEGSVYYERANQLGAVLIRTSPAIIDFSPSETWVNWIAPSRTKLKKVLRLFIKQIINLKEVYLEEEIG